MTDQTAQEPTMEEILASIRRIISEDDAPAETAPAAADAAPAEPEPEDVCPNIDGIQETIPEGLVKNDAGDCVEPEPEPAPAEEKRGLLGSLKSLIKKD